MNKFYVNPAPNAEGSMVLVYREDGAAPRIVAFRDVSVRPLDYDALIAAEVHKPITIPLKWDHAKIVQTNIADLDLDQFYSADATLESPFTARAIGLVNGGWLPSALAAMIDDTTILLDANLISELLGRFGKAGSAKPDFLDLFDDRPIRLNPLLAAMEGQARTIPTPEEMQAWLAKTAPRLQAALPKAKVLADQSMVQGAMGLIEDSRAGFARKEAFLLQVAPMLSAPVGHARRADVWNAVLAGAHETGVQLNSLVVLAALSVTAAPAPDNPAKGVLKFKPGYGLGDAHNALADLRALEILMGLFAHFPAEHIQLCTCDLPLARFWVGLRASRFRRINHGYSFDLAPVEALLPQAALADWRSVTMGAMTCPVSSDHA